MRKVATFLFLALVVFVYMFTLKHQQSFASRTEVCSRER